MSNTCRTIYLNPTMNTSSVQYSSRLYFNRCHHSKYLFRMRTNSSEIERLLGGNPLNFHLYLHSYTIYFVFNKGVHVYVHLIDSY